MGTRVVRKITTIPRALYEISLAIVVTGVIFLLIPQVGIFTSKEDVCLKIVTPSTNTTLIYKETIVKEIVYRDKILSKKIALSSLLNRELFKTNYGSGAEWIAFEEDRWSRIIVSANEEIPRAKTIYELLVSMGEESRNNGSVSATTWFAYQNELTLFSEWYRLLISDTLAGMEEILHD